MPAPPGIIQRFPSWALALLGLALFALFIALGTWQLQRRVWKLDLIERVQQRVHAAAQPMPPEGEWPHLTRASHEYRPVQASGVWLREKTMLVQALTELGAGYWALTPLRLQEGAQASHVLVNRGFVPQELARTWLQGETGALASSAVVTVQGLLRMPEPGGGFLRANKPDEQRWFSRDVAAMAQVQNLARTAPFFIDARLPGHSGNGAESEAWPRAGMTVIHFHNTHLVYALTWYALAAMVLGAAWVVRRLGRAQ